MTPYTPSDSMSFVGNDIPLSHNIGCGSMPFMSVMDNIDLNTDETVQLVASGQVSLDGTATKYLERRVSEIELVRHKKFSGIIDSGVRS